MSATPTVEELDAKIAEKIESIYGKVSRGEIAPSDKTAKVFEISGSLYPDTMKRLRTEFAQTRADLRQLRAGQAAERRANAPQPVGVRSASEVSTDARTAAYPDDYQYEAPPEPGPTGIPKQLPNARQQKVDAIAKARMDNLRFLRGIGAQVQRIDRQERIAKEESRSLQVPGLRNVISGVEQGFNGAVQTLFAGAEALGGDPSVNDAGGMSAYLADYNAGVAKGLAMTDPENPAIAMLSRSVRGATSSLTMAIPLGMTGGTGAVIAGFTAQTAAQSLDEGRQAGLEGRKLAAYTALNAGIEGIVTEGFHRLGLGGFEDFFGPKGLGRASIKGAITGILKALPAEAAEEVVIATLQEANAINNDVRPVQDPEEYARQMVELLTTTAMSVGAAGTTSVLQGASADRQRAERMQSVQLTRDSMVRNRKEMEGQDALYRQEDTQRVDRLNSDQQARAKTEQRQLDVATQSEDAQLEQAMIDAELAALPEPPSRREYEKLTGIAKTSEQERRIAWEKVQPVRRVEPKAKVGNPPAEGEAMPPAEVAKLPASAVQTPEPAPKTPETAPVPFKDLLAQAKTLGLKGYVGKKREVIEKMIADAQKPAAPPVATDGFSPWAASQDEFDQYASDNVNKRSHLSMVGNDVLRAYDQVRAMKGNGVSIDQAIGSGPRELRALHVALAVADGKDIPNSVKADYPLLFPPAVPDQQTSPAATDKQPIPPSSPATPNGTATDSTAAGDANVPVVPPKAVVPQPPPAKPTSPAKAPAPAASVSPVVRDIVAKVGGNMFRLAGDRNVEIRQTFLEALTGTRPPKAKAGVTAVETALAKAIGFDPKDISSYRFGEAVNAWLESTKPAAPTPPPSKAEAPKQPAPAITEGAEAPVSEQQFRDNYPPHVARKEAEKEISEALTPLLPAMKLLYRGTEGGALAFASAVRSRKESVASGYAPTVGWKEVQKKEWTQTFRDRSLVATVLGIEESSVTKQDADRVQALAEQLRQAIVSYYKKEGRGDFEGRFWDDYRRYLSRFSQPDAPTAPTITEGAEAPVAIPSRPSLKARYAVVPISSLKPSHLEDRGFAPNPAHPGNTRDYTSRKDLQQQVDAHAQNLDAGILLDLGAGNERGGPVVLRDGVVLGGNSRAMKLLRAARTYPEAFKRYVEKLRADAAKFGLDPKDVQDDSVLVRVADVQPDAVASTVRTLNDQEQNTESATEEAFAIAKAIPPDAINKLDIRSDETVRDALRREGVDLFLNIMKAGVLTERQIGRYVSNSGKTPTLTPQGMTTLENALVARVVGDMGVYNSLTPFAQDVIARATPVITAIDTDVQNGNLPPEANLLPHVPGAIRILSERGDEVGQADFGSEQGTPQEEALARLFQRAVRSRAKTRSTFESVRNVLAEYRKETAGEVDFLGDKEVPDLTNVLDGVYRGSGAAFMGGWHPSMENDLFPEMLTVAPKNDPDPVIWSLPDIIELARNSGVMTRVVEHAKWLGLFKSNGKEGGISLRADLATGPVVEAREATMRGAKKARETTIRSSVARFLKVHGASDPEIALYIKDGTVPNGFTVVETPRMRGSEADVTISKLGNEVATLRVTMGSVPKKFRRSIVVQKVDPDFGKKVAAHEAGHMIDWLDDKTLKRGNIMGRLASLFRNAQTTLAGVIGTDNEIRQELIGVTKWWSGDYAAGTPKYIKYRESSVELYAEAWSVLLNNPAELQRRAPKFYTALFDLLGNKPELKAEYDRIVAEIRSGNTYERAVAKANDAQAQWFDLSQEAAKQLERERFHGGTFGQIMGNAMVDVGFALKSAAARANPKALSTTVEDAYDRAVYAGDFTWLYQKRLNETVLAPLRKAGIELTDFNNYLAWLRMVKERDGMFNPVEPRQAEAHIERLKSDLGPAKAAKMDAIRDALVALRRPLIDRLRESKALSPELMAYIDNNEYYVTFSVVDQLATQFTEAGGASADGGKALGIMRQIGTVNQVGPAVITTALNDMMLMRLVEWNEAKRETVAFWRKNFPKEIMNAETKGNVPQPPKRATQGLVTYLAQGKVVGVYLPWHIAAAFDRQHSVHTVFSSRLMKWINGVPRGLFTYLNPFFPLVNVPRDYFRAARNLPVGKDIGTLRKYAVVAGLMVKSTPEALRAAYGDVLGPTVEAMFKKGLLIPPGVAKRLLLEDDSLAADLNVLNQQKPGAARRTAEALFKGIAAFTTDLNQAAEIVTKIAAYKYLEKYGKNMSKADKNWMVRAGAGSPSFITRGKNTPVLNELFLFSNVWAQSNRSNLRIAAKRPGQIGAGMMVSLAPMILQHSIRAGLLTMIMLALYGLSDDSDEEEKQAAPGVAWAMAQERRFKKVGDFDANNFGIIPTTDFEDGTLGYIRVPLDEQDRLASALAAAIVRSMQGDPMLVEQLAAVGGGETPGWAPSIEAANALRSFVMGQNPFDPFFQRNVIDKDVFEARTTGPDMYDRAAKQMGMDAWNNLGGSMFFRFDPMNRDQKKNETAEFLTNPLIGPGIQKLFKVTNQGERDADRKAASGARSEEARKRVLLKEAALAERDGKPLTAEQQAIIEQDPKRMERAQKNRTRYDSSDPLLQSIEGAQSVPERDAITLARVKADPKLRIAPYVQPQIKQKAADILRNPMPTLTLEERRENYRKANGDGKKAGELIGAMAKAKREKVKVEREAAIQWLKERRITVEEVIEADPDLKGGEREQLRAALSPAKK